MLDTEVSTVTDKGTTLELVFTEGINLDRQYFTKPLAKLPFWKVSLAPFRNKGSK